MKSVLSGLLLSLLLAACAGEDSIQDTSIDSDWVDPIESVDVEPGETIEKASCDPLCSSSCTADCADLFGSAKGACLLACRKLCCGGVVD